MGEVIKLKVATSEEAISLKSASGSLAVEAVSPRVSLEKVDGGTRMDITDVEGTKSTIIPDGEKGDPGESYIFDEYPTDNSPNPVRSRGLKSKFDSVRSDIQHYYDSAVEAVLNSEIRLNMKFGQKQDVLTFDEYPTANSDNPVKSNGIKILIDAIASTIPRRASDLIDDSGHYTKPPQGIPASDLAYGVIPDISQKQDLLSFDQTPTLKSVNPVTSNGIKRAIDTVYNQLSRETDLKLLAKADRVNECTEGNFAALDENGNLTDSRKKASDFVTDVQVNGTSVLSNGVANLSSMSDGTTFTPSVSSEGVISWTNDGGKTNPQSVNIKGPQGDPGNDYTLTSEDKNEIANLAMTLIAFPSVAVASTGRTINYKTGGVNLRTGFNASAMVDVSAYPAIRYSRVKSTYDTYFMGIAFYDEDSTFIENSGVPSIINQSALSYTLHDVAVPTGAKYARFTMLADTQTYGAFELYGIPAAMWELEHKQDALTFDSAPTSGSTNPVTSGGVYTAIQAKANLVTVETVSGTDPVIVGADNHCYVCGTCDTLTLTPPASGTIEVMFTSGSTAIVLSLPNTVKMPDWWAGTEPNRVYDLIITDGVYGVVASWSA